MRRMLFWIVLLSAGLAGAARWAWVDFWSHHDEIVATRLQAYLQEQLPDWRIEFDRVEWLQGGRLRVSGVRAGGRQHAAPLLKIPELLLALDPALLRDQMQVLITRVDLRQPILSLVRSPDGVWNYVGLSPPPRTELPLPEIHLHQGIVRLRLEASEYLPASELQLHDINATLSSDRYRHYRLEGHSSVDAAGGIEFSGALDVDRGTWTLAGECLELGSADDLLALAAGLSDNARHQLQSLATRLHGPRTQAAGGGPTDGSEFRGDGVPARPVARSRGSTAEPPTSPDSAESLAPHGSQPATAPPLQCGPHGCSIPELGVAARVQLAFRLDQSTGSRPLQYQLTVRLKEGVIDNPALPVPLQDLSGEIYVDNTLVILRSLQAANGTSRLFLDGYLARDPAAPAKRFVLQARNLEFGREIEQHLCPDLCEIYNALRPAGRFNIDLVAETNGHSEWEIHLNQFEACDCSILPAAFPYPVHHITGQVRQERERFLLDFAGLAGDRPVTMRGELRNPGADLQYVVELHVDSLPLDAPLRQALTSAKLAPVGMALDRLRLSGLADVDARLTLTGPPDDPVDVALDVRLHHAAANFVPFPYLVTDLAARIQFDPLAEDPARRDIWLLTGIEGRHGPARLTAAGAFATRGSQTLLDLELTAIGLPIDRDLEAACITASPVLREAFDAIGRSGTVDLQNVRVLWSPRTRPVIALPSIVVKDAALRLKQWPFAWERATGTLAWEQNRLSIAQLTAWHGAETYLQIDNHGEPAAAVLQFPSQGDVGWHLHLEDVQVRRIVPDATFRNSLASTGLAAVIEQLDPRGPLDLHLGLDLKGSRTNPSDVTAAWTLDATLLGNSLRTGVELTDMSGRVKVERGIWNGEANFIDGHFRLDSVNIVGLPITAVEGPFLVDGPDIYVGTPTWPEVGRPPAYDATLNPRAGQQAHGDIYKGKLGFDVHARLSRFDAEQTVYRASISLRDALLEELARDRGVAADRLRGPVNGRIDLLGQGTSDRNVRGSGWVQVSPAQLYELPVLNRMLASLELRQPDTTAFRYAYGQFTLHDGVVDFSEIQLLGESLLLVGRGQVAFGAGLNQQLAIEFLRSKFRNRIPLVGQAISALTSNSIGVRVGGTLSNPIVDVQPKLGLVDDTLRKLIEGFEAGQNPGPPRIVPLPTQPLPRQPAGAR